MNHYQVLFSGEVAEGAQEEKVRTNLSRELGIDARKIGQLFSGRTVVIRSQLSQDDALAMQARFADLGALVRIKDLTPQQKQAIKDYQAQAAARSDIDRQAEVKEDTVNGINI